LVIYESKATLITMAKETKSFGNVLGKLHGNKPASTVPVEPAKSEKAPVKVRKRITFFVDQRLEKMIDTGTLEEKYRSKSDFVEFILLDYFKDKPYLKS
jgi:hypothetical protein